MTLSTTSIRDLPFSQSLSRFFERVGELSRNFKSDKAKDTIKVRYMVPKVQP